MRTNELTRHLIAELSPTLGPDEAASVARLVLEDLFGWRAGQRPRPLSRSEELLASATAKRLIAGEPAQYVTGIADFYGLQLNVTPAVLIPRPETEELVEWILEDNRPSGASLNVIDVGTGSGCIALALKHNRPRWRVSVLDVSEAALAVAHGNAERLRIDLRRGGCRDFLKVGFGPVDKPFDLVVSNPPYIPPSERSRMGPSVVQHEPDLALFVPEDDPLTFYRRLAEEAPKALTAGGSLYVETNEYNNDRVLSLFNRMGLENIEVRRDLQGKRRMVRATRP